MNRRLFLRWFSLLLGVAVLFAHIAVWREPGARPHWLSLDPHDALYHFIALSLFTIAYYLSFSPRYSDIRKGGKTALYSPGDTAFGLSRMFEIIGELRDVPIDLKVFRDKDQALQWLDR